MKLYGPYAAKNPDNVLEQAIGKYKSMLVIGWDIDNNLDIRSTLDLDVGEILELIELFKFKLLRGDYGSIK